MQNGLGSLPGTQWLARGIGWRAAVPLLRARARRRLGSLHPGAATIVTVNWNSWEHCAVLIDLVHRRSPAGTEILVVDNASEDGSREKLRARSGLRHLLLPVNMGHDLAMDLGVLLCETEYAVPLDVDAFPLHEHWLEDLLGPLDERARGARPRLHRRVGPLRRP